MTSPRPYPPQRRPGTQGCGVLGLGIAAFIILGFWPAFIVHGQTDTGGWKLSAGSVYACLAWWGALAFIWLMVWLGNRPAKEGRP